MFLTELPLFFDHMINDNMKEAKKNKCRLDGSTKEGHEALLKFLYFRGVENALNSSVVAYELLDLGHKYDISRLEEMRCLLLAKQDEWWDLEVAINLLLRTRDKELCTSLKNKAKQVLKMKRAESTSDCNTLISDLMAKDPKAAKELMRFLPQQDDLDCARTFV